MKMMRNVLISEPFMVNDEHCIVYQASQHIIRIFYMGHVYDVALTNDESMTWNGSSVECRKRMVTQFINDRLMCSKSERCNPSAKDGYIA